MPVDFTDLIGPVIRSKTGGFKYGQSSTHWRKLVAKVNLGAGGECPLMLVGIEPQRIEGVELAYQVREKLDEAAAVQATWRDHYERWNDARPVVAALRNEALDLLPPIGDDSDD